MAVLPERQMGARTGFQPEGRLAQFWKRVKQNKVSYLFVAPYGLLFFLFTVLPVGVAVVLSFTDYNMLQPPQWVGWKNYLRLFLADDVFLIAVKNTFVFAVITGPVSYLASFVFAWLINDLRPKIRAVLTLLLYAPSIAGSLYLIWTIIFSGDAYGLINSRLLYLGIIKDPIQFLTDPKWMMGVVIIVVLWMSLGTSFLAFIAGLQGIDSSLYEAAAWMGSETAGRSCSSSPCRRCGLPDVQRDHGHHQFVRSRGADHSLGWFSQHRLCGAYDCGPLG